MKQMLITGASRGIGKAIQERFCEEYDIVSVARTQDGTITEVGDLLDESFVEHLIEQYSPDVFINNAGTVETETDPKTLKRVIDLNLTASIQLLQGFYDNMDDGQIINIGSLAADLQGYGIDPSRLSYIYTKSGLHKASELFSQMGARDVRVTLLSLGSVATTIKNRFYGKEIPESEYDHQTWRTIPMRTSDVADAVEWILAQPKHLTIPKLEINNTIISDARGRSSNSIRK